ncbi:MULTISPECIES: hypothetical protein [Brevibacillus]|uniref:DUF4309 domain-containing protein n=1 Tax=Brevibacillus invocatus TaxID=173959 RepID=A0A3M8CGC4_9BACL|nr:MULTISPECIES: hypothetical protein [Brevibacillus]MCM3079008.1 hypothetical protein [Brevibacillus invocatus]MCM3432071.1 hypothetical protein [Brevibacillus invocatus]MDH4619649.1 hypothetical protein [Brevibacillus sp. AY1]RNB74806.1 hypothetical protein EDM52_08755 [Brevibacillus invocatus]
MKKNRMAALGLALLCAGSTFFITNQLSANEPYMIEKLNNQSTLEVLGIEVDTDAIKSTHSVKDKNVITDVKGKKWVYIEYTDITPFIDDLENYYEVDFVGTFIDVQSAIMRKHAQIGDQIPIILLDEDLHEGTFSFTRESGETLSFPIQFDSKKGWTYKEPVLFESAR